MTKVVKLHDKNKKQKPQKIVRIHPELDGVEFAYTSSLYDGKVFKNKIAGWALTDDGKVFPFSPHLKLVQNVLEINDPLTGSYVGLLDANQNRCDSLLEHRTQELKLQHEYWQSFKLDANVVQQIQDTSESYTFGLSNNSFFLKKINGWRLSNTGEIIPILLKEDCISTPASIVSVDAYETMITEDFKFYLPVNAAISIINDDEHAMDMLTRLFTEQ